MFKERKSGFSMIIIITWYVNISKYQRRLHSFFSVSQMLHCCLEYLSLYQFTSLLQNWVYEQSLHWVDHLCASCHRTRTALRGCLQPAWRAVTERSGANRESSHKTTVWCGKAFSFFVSGSHTPGCVAFSRCHSKLSISSHAVCWRCS